MGGGHGGHPNLAGYYDYECGESGTLGQGRGGLIRLHDRCYGAGWLAEIGVGLVSSYGDTNKGFLMTWLRCGELEDGTRKAIVNSDNIIHEFVDY